MALTMSPRLVTPPFLAGLLAVATSAGLLVTFHQVVSGSVQQGDLRRQASTALADATWRCNALRAPTLRDVCLLQTTAPPQQRDVAQMQGVATADSGAGVGE